MMGKFLWAGIIALTACTNSQDLSKKAVQEIVETDQAMSAMATKQGFHKALLTYADEEVIKPEADQYPVMGRKNLEAAWASSQDFTNLSWEPSRAEASRSGDMGYTFGNWMLVLKDTTLYGNYTTIWKRQPDGNWKFVLDGGNSTPPPPRN